MLRRSINSALAACLAALSGPNLAASQDILNSFENRIDPLLDKYCYDCHGYGVSEGNLTLDEFTAETIGDKDLWQRVLKNTRAHIMPPRDEWQPEDGERKALGDWIKTQALGLNFENPDPGPMTIQRLNRLEYRNTVKDLLGVDFDTVDAFPPDDSGEGFDNIGDVLTLSPMMLEKYLDAAQTIVSQVVPTESAVVAEDTLDSGELIEMFNWTPPANEANSGEMEISFYEPSAYTAAYNVEHAGDYEIDLRLKPVRDSSYEYFDRNSCRFIFKVDGITLLDQEFVNTSGKEFAFTFDGAWPAGAREFSIEVQPAAPGSKRFQNLRMRIEGMTIRGPMSSQFWVPPENYETVFGSGIPAHRAERLPYTRRLLGDFASKAFRRPVDRPTLNTLVALSEEIASQPGNTPEMGIAQSMVAILASPRFLFREEEVEKLAQGQAHPRIDEYSLASRLSYFLWSTMPDDELLSLASEGRLRENLRPQIKRMLADEKTDNFLTNFAGQWLHARDVGSLNVRTFEIWLRDHPNPELQADRETYMELRGIPENLRTPEQQALYTKYRAKVIAASDLPRPSWDSPLRRAARQETELYFKHVFQEDRSVLELLDSDYTFLNKRLAEHYDIEGVEGTRMRKVALEPGHPRGGVLTHTSILAFTSNPTRTSPVKRGVFILENILGIPPAPPPPDVPSLEEAASEGAKGPISLRESLAIHREKPLCRSCHERMDPLGLAFENFNAMGIWRDSELNLPIETGGVLISGEEFGSVSELKRILATDRKIDFYYCLSEKLLTYALGRGLEYYDIPTLDRLVNELESTDGRPSALMVGIIESDPFQRRRHTNFNPN